MWGFPPRDVTFAVILVKAGGYRLFERVMAVCIAVMFGVVVLTAINLQAHVLSFDRPTGEIRYLMSAGHLANHSLGISPDGERFLVKVPVGGDTGERLHVVTNWTSLLER